MFADGPVDVIRQSRLVYAETVVLDGTGSTRRTSAAFAAATGSFARGGIFPDRSDGGTDAAAGRVRPRPRSRNSWPAVLGLVIPFAGCGRRPRSGTERNHGAHAPVPLSLAPAAGAGAVDGERARAAAVRAGPPAGRRTAPHTCCRSRWPDREDCAPDSSPALSTLRFHGVLGPRGGWRSAVIPRRPEAVEEGPLAAGRSEGTGPRAELSPGSSLGAPSESSMRAALLRLARLAAALVNELLPKALRRPSPRWNSTRVTVVDRRGLG
jgi:hypothetical protein